jgi:hypothetical protein
MQILKTLQELSAAYQHVEAVGCGCLGAHAWDCCSCHLCTSNPFPVMTGSMPLELIV